MGMAQSVFRIVLLTTVALVAWLPLQAEPPEAPADAESKPADVGGLFIDPAIPLPAPRGRPQLLGPAPTKVLSDINAVIAQVNNEVITLEDILRPMRPQMAEWRKEMPAEQFAQRLRNEISARLQNEISRILLFQNAEEVLTERDKEEIQKGLDKELKKMIEEAGSEEALARQLKGRGLTLEEHKVRLRQERFTQRLFRRKINPRIYVTRQDLLDYYAKLKAKQFTRTTKVKLRLIVLKKGEFANEEAARGLADAVEERAKGGEDFEKLARRFSHGMMAEAGGLWGFVQKGSFKVKAVDEALFKLPRGGVSDLIETDDAFYIVQAADRREARIVPFTEVQKELKRALRKQRFNELLNALIAKLYRKAYVSIKTKNL